VLADAEERLAQIRIEREAVADYFQNLRTIVTRTESVNSEG
jgi:hypothetical protein